MITVKRYVANIEQFTLGFAPFGQLVRLLEPMGGLPKGVIGYAHRNQFVVVAGYDLTIVDARFNTPVEILKSGTLVLEIT